MGKWIKKQKILPFLFLNLNKQYYQGHVEAAENLSCYRSKAFGIAVILGFSMYLNYSAVALYNSKRKM